MGGSGAHARWVGSKRYGEEREGSSGKMQRRWERFDGWRWECRREKIRVRVLEEKKERHDLEVGLRRPWKEMGM